MWKHAIALINFCNCTINYLFMVDKYLYWPNTKQSQTFTYCALDSLPQKKKKKINKNKTKQHCTLKRKKKKTQSKFPISPCFSSYKPKFDNISTSVNTMIWWSPNWSSSDTRIFFFHHVGTMASSIMNAMFGFFHACLSTTKLLPTPISNFESKLKEPITDC